MNCHFTDEVHGGLPVPVGNVKLGSKEWVHFVLYVTSQKKYWFFVFPIYPHFFPQMTTFLVLFFSIFSATDHACDFPGWSSQPEVQDTPIARQEGWIMETTVHRELDQRQEPLPQISLQVAKPLVALGEKFNWKPEEMPWEEIWLYPSPKLKSKTHSHGSLL